MPEHGVVRNGYKRRPRDRGGVFVHRWNGALIWYTYIDDDRLDAEILLARTVSGRIGKDELGEVLGITPGTVHTGIYRGLVPRPHYDTPDGTITGGENGSPWWTDDQVVDVVLARAAR